MRGLLQFLGNAPARSNGDAQPEIDPVMVANGYVWPIPKQSQSTWLGVIAFLGLMALLSFSSLGSPLIDKAASQVNLTAADLGSDFILAEERRAEDFNDESLRDASQRTWEGTSSAVQATVLVGKQRSGDSLNALLAAFDKSIRQDPSVVASFELPHSVSAGKQGALESFQIQVENRKVEGYLLSFIRDNVVVFVLELGPLGTITEDMVVSHARLIDQRLQ